MELKCYVKTLCPRYTNMTLPNIFYFMNFFVRPTVKKWRQKCAKKRPKCAPPPPLTPPNPFFWLGGMSSILPKPKTPITLHYMPNLRCSVPTVHMTFEGLWRQNVRFWAISGARTKNLFSSKMRFRPK